MRNLLREVVDNRTKTTKHEISQLWGVDSTLFETLLCGDHNFYPLTTISILFESFVVYLSFNPKPGGGQSYVPTAQEIAFHFSQDHARVLKLLGFFKNDVGLRVKESF